MASSPHDKAQPMSLRERKKRLTHITIEETALRLFQQRGYEQTSIQDIADAVMMSPRTFFRYFASKEELLFVPLHTVLGEGIRSLQHVPSTASPHTALRAILLSLALLFQQQRASFLLRYQVAMQTPPLASMYLYALMERESALSDALCAHLESATNRHEISLLVAIHMAVLRVALLEWLEHGTQGDLTSLLREHLDDFSSLSHQAHNDKSIFT